MNVVTSWRQGDYAAGQFALVMHNRAARFDQTRPGILCFHGRNATGASFMQHVLFGLTPHITALLNEGYIVYSIDAGGLTTWGNDVAMDAALAALDRMEEMTKPGMSALMGWSMGGLNALNFMKRHPSRLRGAFLWAPAADLGWAHSQPAWTTEINNAYGGNYAVNSVGHDPASEPAAYRDLPPIHVVSSEDDDVLSTSETEDFVAAVNDPNLTMETLSSGAHFPFNEYDQEDSLGRFKEWFEWA